MRTRDKRGISNIIGYIMLMGIVIIMSVIVFQWLRTYVPTDSIDCPDGVGISIESLRYYCDNKELSFTLKNTGRFNIAGYFIHATTSPDQEIAIEDLSLLLNPNSTGNVIFNPSENSLKPNDKIDAFFNLSTSGISRIYSIELIPVRYQKQNNKDLIVSCTGAKIEPSFGCFENVTTSGGGLCEPLTCNDFNYSCGSGWDNGCGGILSCGICSSGQICNAGTCVDSGSCEPPLTCNDLGYICGEQIVCGVNTDCGSCNSTSYCAPSGQQCLPLCGNGIIDTSNGEECDDGNILSGDGCSYPSCQIESGWICIGTPSVCTTSGGGGGASCVNYCLGLGLGYTSSSCPANNGQCNSVGGDPQPGGIPECDSSGAPPGSVCCCFPGT